jgi:hypothetical protein
MTQTAKVIIAGLAAATVVLGVALAFALTDGGGGIPGIRPTNPYMRMMQATGNRDSDAMLERMRESSVPRTTSACSTTSRSIDEAGLCRAPGWTA